MSISSIKNTLLRRITLVAFWPGWALTVLLVSALEAAVHVLDDIGTATRDAWRGPSA